MRQTPEHRQNESWQEEWQIFIVLCGTLERLWWQRQSKKWGHQWGVFAMHMREHQRCYSVTAVETSLPADGSLNGRNNQLEKGQGNGHLSPPARSGRQQPGQPVRSLRM